MFAFLDRSSAILTGCLLALSSGLAAADKRVQINYQQLDLQVTVTSFRSGNHDPGGEGEYFFEATVYGLPILKEEIRKPFPERQKVERKHGEFGQITIKNLKFWQAEKKPNPAFSLAIPGDLMREIVSDTMRQFKVTEDQVAILCKIVLFERGKKFGFFGEDLRVGEAQLFVIPETLPHAPVIKNQDLTIEDDLGTYATLQFRFKSLGANSEG